MRILATTTKGGLDDIITPMFARAPTFTVVEVENKQIKDVKIIQNQASMQPSGAGIAATQTVCNLGVNVVLTGNVGPNAFHGLSSAGIKIYRADGLKVEEAIRKFLNNELLEITSPMPGMKGGMGRGRGMGRGMGRFFRF